MTVRCPWCVGNPLYIAYHDNEWGVPLREETQLFEMLILEGAQDGLSWLTILKKRLSYQQAFASFNPVELAHFTRRDVERLMQNPGIIRNRLKIQAAITNARAVLAMWESGESLSELLWSFVDGKPVTNYWASIDDVPAQTAASQKMSQALKERGFRFVGPTICYALMQSIGMVNDHLVGCFRHGEILAQSNA